VPLIPAARNCRIIIGDVKSRWPGFKGEPFPQQDVGYAEALFPSPHRLHRARARQATDLAPPPPAEKARAEEEQRRYAEEYWAQRDAEAAADRKEAEEAEERYQEAFRETFRIREAYP
jgi:hypothetical protein